MTMPTMTLLFAGLCGLLQFVLTAIVILRRAQTGIHFLDGGDQRLIHRIRAHGNFTETAPMALLLMALLEMNGLSQTWLMSFGIALLLGRILHARSLLTDNAIWSRLGGMILTLAVISVEGLCALWVFLSDFFA